MGAGREWQRTRFLPGEVRVRAPPHPPIFACVTGTKKTSTAQTCRIGGASPPAGTNIWAGDGNRIPQPLKTVGLEVQVLPGLRARDGNQHTSHA